MENLIRIILVENHALLRRAYVENLNVFNIITIGEAENGYEALALLNIEIPDVLLLDINMPILDGNDTFKILCFLYPALKIIMFTSHDHNLFVNDYEQRGAKGYVVKNKVLYNELAEIIRIVHAGGVFFMRRPININNDK